MNMNQSFVSIGRGAKVAVALLSTLALLGAGQHAPAASPSELLEKGVYSEETKGDLDAALQLYQQVISEAKGGQELAAQAQYRLGVCYYKKKNLAEANAAFEKLIKDYPDQKDLIARANEYLAGSSALLPPPWVDGEELRLDIKLGGGLKVGTACYSIASGETNRQKIWRMSSRMSAGVQSVSHVEVEGDSFKPIHSQWKHMLLGDVETFYGPTRAELKTAGKEAVKAIDLNGAIIDNEETIEWMRRLPLSDGYQASARILASLAGGIIGVKFTVSGPEKLEVPAGSFDCYKVELNINQTFWYSTDAHHYLVKFEGGGVIAELASITQRSPGSAVTYQDATDHFSLLAPAGWVFDRTDGAHGNSYTVAFLDPGAVGNTGVDVKSLEKIPAQKKSSLRAWANSEAEEAATLYKDFKVRADSWKEQTVGGQPAISLIADYTAGKDKNIAYAVLTKSGNKGLIFECMVSAKDFEALRPDFDAIVDSYKSR